MTKPKNKKWTANEDLHLLTMVKCQRKLQDMALRFDTTQEACIDRLQFLKDNPPKEQPNQKSEDLTPPKETTPFKESPPPIVETPPLVTDGKLLNEADAIDVLVNSAFAAHNNGAVALSNISAVLGTRLSHMAILDILLQIESLHASKNLTEEEKTPLLIFLANTLNEHYILIPKPRIVKSPT